MKTVIEIAKSIPNLNFTHEVALMQFAAAIREQDKARIAQLEDALFSLSGYGSSVVQSITENALNSGNKSDWLAKHNEPLLARIAMLVQSLECEHGGDHYESGCPICEALATTQPEVDAWLEQRDAQIRRDERNKCFEMATEYVVVNEQDGRKWIELEDLYSVTVEQTEG